MARTYALSDIHGHLNKLAALVARCRSDAGDDGAKFIFLGDYIDRGPDSRGVIEYLIDLQRQRPGDVVCLCGNHEDLALSAIDDPGEIDQWVATNSGDTTLRSYGVMARGRQGPPASPRGARRWAAGARHAPRRWPALLRSCRCRSVAAAEPTGPARSALDAGTVSVRSSRLWPLDRPRPHAVERRPARSADEPGEHRHGRRSARATHRGHFRRPHDRAGRIPAREVTALLGLLPVLCRRSRPNRRTASVKPSWLPARLARHSTGAPAGGPAGVSPDASAIRSATHAGTAGLAHLDDRLILRKLGYGRQRLRRRRQGQSKANSDQPDHCFSPVLPSSCRESHSMPTSERPPLSLWLYEPRFGIMQFINRVV